MARSGGTYQKGQSGNPKGRPPGKSFRTVLKAELSKPDPGKPGETRYEAWAKQIIDEASLGDNQAKMEVIKFLEGASPADKGEPPEELEDAQSTDDNGNPVDP